jgi:hypothetical protein
VEIGKIQATLVIRGGYVLGKSLEYQNRRSQGCTVMAKKLFIRKNLHENPWITEGKPADNKFVNTKMNMRIARTTCIVFSQESSQKMSMEGGEAFQPI